MRECQNMKCPQCPRINHKPQPISSNRFCLPSPFTFRHTPWCFTIRSPANNRPQTAHGMTDPPAPPASPALPPRPAVSAAPGVFRYPPSSSCPVSLHCAPEDVLVGSIQGKQESSFAVHHTANLASFSAFLLSPCGIFSGVSPCPV